MKFSSIFKKGQKQSKSSTEAKIQTIPVKKSFNVKLSADEDKENVYQINDDEDDDDDFEIVEEDKIEKENESTNENDKESSPSLEESKQTEIKSDPSLLEYEKDQNSTCHKILIKGTLLDLADRRIIKCLKIKKVKPSVFSMFSGSNSKQVERKYMAYFDENYLYFLKDIEMNKKANLRKVGNKYNLRLLYNSCFNKLSDKRWKARLIFFKDNFGDMKVTKELILDQEELEKFYNMLSFYFNKIGIQTEDSENAHSISDRLVTK